MFRDTDGGYRVVSDLASTRRGLDCDRLLACTGCQTKRAQFPTLFHLQLGVLSGSADRGLRGPTTHRHRLELTPPIGSDCNIPARLTRAG